jgi:hypothetical protein
LDWPLQGRVELAEKLVELGDWVAVIAGALDGPQGPGKVTIRPDLSKWPHIVAGRHATALVQAGSQIPATSMFWHWCRPRLCWALHVNALGVIEGLVARPKSGRVTSSASAR